MRGLGATQWVLHGFQGSEKRFVGELNVKKNRHQEQSIFNPLALPHGDAVSLG